MSINDKLHQKQLFPKWSFLKYLSTLILCDMIIGAKIVCFFDICKLFGLYSENSFSFLD